MSELAPLPSVIRDAIPNKVDYSIHVVWGDGRLETYVGYGQSFLEAAEKLEILADELRAAVKDTSGVAMVVQDQPECGGERP